jgi:hypothetical protein
VAVRSGLAVIGIGPAVRELPPNLFKPNISQKNRDSVQGDQIGLFFAHWVAVIFWQFF